MIKLFVFSLLAIVLAVAINLTTGFPADPGYLMIAFGNTTFETSLFALLVAMGVIFLALRLLLLLFYAISPFRLIRLGKSYNQKRKSRKRTKSVEGFLAFARGDWQTAYGLLNRGAKQEDSTVANYLAAAYAAHELGDKDAWTKTLEVAEQEYPTTRSTIQYVKAQLLFKSDQLEQCLAILEQMKNSSTKDTGPVNLLKEVYIKLQEWQKLEGLLPLLEKKKIVDGSEAEKIRKRVFMEQLYESAETSDKGDNQREIQNLESLGRLWKKAPAKFREDDKVVKHYSNLLVRLGAKADAAKALEMAISKNWSKELVTIYGSMDYDSNQQQLLVAEGWLKARPANAEIQLCLGRICLRNELWGKAKEYYLASIKLSPSAEAYGELSRLLKSLGEEAESETCLQHYSELIGVTLTDLPLPQRTKAGV